MDLNADLGESFGNYTIGNDERIIPLVSSVNVACGFHAGDPVVIERTLATLKKNKHVALGAHPSYPDLQGFGRRYMALEMEELKSAILYQLSALTGMARVHGLELIHVKPHGALYNHASVDRETALTIAQTIKIFNPQLKLVGLSGSELINAGRETGLDVINEVFADRTYRENGQLMSRQEQGAVIEEEQKVVEQAVRMFKYKTVETKSGKEITVEADTICVHGDNPKAVTLIEAMRKAFEENGIKIGK